MTLNAPMTTDWGSTLKISNGLTLNSGGALNGPGNVSMAGGFNYAGGSIGLSGPLDIIHTGNLSLPGISSLTALSARHR